MVKDRYLKQKGIDAHELKGDFVGKKNMSHFDILIALLYDRTQDDFEVNQQCLEMWDEMFESRVGTIRELTRTIMDM